MLPIFLLTSEWLVHLIKKHCTMNFNTLSILLSLPCNEHSYFLLTIIAVYFWSSPLAIYRSSALVMSSFLMCICIYRVVPVCVLNVDILFIYVWNNIVTLWAWRWWWLRMRLLQGVKFWHPLIHWYVSTSSLHHY